jgi:hypothetical protein
LLTGGTYGPEGSLTAVVVLVVGLIVLLRVTRDYAWKYAQPLIVSGGIPVDLDAAQARVHEAAQAQSGDPAAPKLVQIAAVTSLSPTVIPGADASEISSAPPVKVEAELPPDTERPS